LEKGLVSRKESSDDRRYQDIELTAKGIQLVPKLGALADQNDREFFSCLNKAERSQLKAVLQKLADHFQIKTVPTQ
ncbi:MAG: MarR family winged helix-turn-helix transcriptional regulator, partial [Bacteriovoracia bacterium]